MAGPEKLTISLPSSVVTKLRSVARKEDRPLSVVVRRALEAYFDAPKKGR